MMYLEIHGLKNGKKTFDCGTSYDWYLIRKTKRCDDTVVINEISKRNEINLSLSTWLPNSNMEEIKKILASNNEERCPILHSSYHSTKKIMSHTKDDILNSLVFIQLQRQEQDLCIVK